MLVLDDKKDCTGCAACAQKCPKTAIAMQPDEEGFLYPIIDESKCIHCDVCRKICPQNRKGLWNNTPMAYWGGVIRDEAELLKSSSGGAFTGICKVLPTDAVICGVTYDEQLKVHHAAVPNGDEIDCFRKSKYLQSDVRDIYKQVKQFLTDGKTVLFTGTACQVAGLYAYLGNKPEKLYTVDLICHGVPSQKVFDAYITSLEKKKKISIREFSFRDKSYFWGDWEIGTGYGDERKWKHQAWGQDIYMTGFLRGLFYRPACYRCQYANGEIARPADLTIGDFWGIDRLSPVFHDKKGASLIVVSSQKGEELVSRMKSVMELIPVSRENAIAENHNLIEPTRQNPNREAFFCRLLAGEDFITVMQAFRKGKSHSQVVRVLVTKVAPWLVERKRKKVRAERNSR